MFINKFEEHYNVQWRNNMTTKTTEKQLNKAEKQ